MKTFHGAITGLLAAGNVLLAANLVLSAAPRAEAQELQAPRRDAALFGGAVLPVPESPAAAEPPTFVAEPTPTVSRDAVRALPDVIRARSFEVVDDDGRVVVRIGLDAAGEAGIVTTDADGNPLTVFGAFRGGGMVATFDRAGKPLVMIRQDLHGNGEITYGSEPAAEQRDRARAPAPDDPRRP